MASTKTKNADGSAANLGFEAKLWLTADKLRKNMVAFLDQLFYSTQPIEALTV